MLRLQTTRGALANTGARLIQLHQHLPAATLPAALRIQSSSSSRRNFASSHGHDSHDVKPVDPNKPSMHPEEYLEIGRKWPHEYYYPENYRMGTPDEEFTVNPALHQSAQPTGAETVTQRREDFSSPIWTRVLALAIVGAALYRVNEYYTAGLDEHPFTTWMRGYIFGMDDPDNCNKNWIAIRQREADDRLIKREFSPVKTMHRISFPDMFQRASDHLIVPGSQIDVSDVQVKTKWQENDKYVGAPFPKQ
ncbi:hypothetical protein HK102_010569 [Quaeritorhiza haematococci]|nr:hypothetical protein HK102_010569 [Quaeritorhiza haematococci]